MAEDSQGSPPAVPDNRAEPSAALAVSDPAELIRVASMIQALVVEIRDMELDEASRKRLGDVHARAVSAVRELVSGELDHELTELGVPIEDGDATGPELRIAHAQLLGWLNGLFQGIQAAMAAQQFAAAQRSQQLQQAPRPGLPGEGPPGGQYL